MTFEYRYDVEHTHKERMALPVLVQQQVQCLIFERSVNNKMTRKSNRGKAKQKGTRSLADVLQEEEQQRNEHRERRLNMILKRDEMFDQFQDEVRQLRQEAVCRK
jgi:hypothetical protein